MFWMAIKFVATGLGCNKYCCTLQWRRGSTFLSVSEVASRFCPRYFGVTRKGTFLPGKAHTSRPVGCLTWRYEKEEEEEEEGEEEKEEEAKKEERKPATGGKTR